MRVLWFTNTPSLSAQHLNNTSVGGGWIDSLEAKITENSSVELGVCFNLEGRYIKPFKVNKTIYFPVPILSSTNKFKKLISNWSKPIQGENDIQPYLSVIQEFKPDVINIFGTEGPFGLIISKVEVPCIIHLQGNLVMYNYKWFSGLTAIDILKYSKKSSVIKGYGLFHKYFINTKAAEREKKIFLKCKYFMGRTDWDKRLSSVLSPGSKYFHCDEIMRPQFYMHQWIPKKESQDYTIITTIRNNIYKGLETIYECKKILISLNLDLNITWKIAGISESDEITYLIERKYRDKFKQWGIQLLGPLCEKDLIPQMLSADLFVHPSHIDNSPNSLCEAMLLGMPVISTFAGGIPSIVDNKKNGLLVQDGDPYALAGVILELIENTDYASKLGVNARDKAMIRHNSERIVNELLNIYSSINL